MSDALGKLTQAIIDGEPDDARAAAQASLDAGVEPLTAIHAGGVKALQEVGDPVALYQSDIDKYKTILEY